MAQKYGTTVMLIVVSLHLFFCPVIIISSARSLNTSTDESSLLSIGSLITSDPNSIISTNWSQGTSFCTWIGVTCSSRHQRVTALNLFNFELTGTISPQIGNLSFLTFLDLRNNSFTGLIPATIGNLLRLRELRMSLNQLSGNVPPSLGFLRNLEILDLSDNSLRGNIPWGIFNITSLREIGFARNYELSGELPRELCPPSARLQQLRLSGNQIRGEIPRGLSNCAQLSIIFLSRNNLTGKLPVEIGGLSQLQILALGGNLLTGHIPSSIGNLSNLDAIDLSHNNFEGTIPSEMGHLSSLMILSLGLNQLNGELPPSIFNLTRLQTLSLTVNQLSGTIPPSIDIMLPNLQYLYLAGNMFSGGIPDTISNLSLLTIIEISNNSFTGLLPVNLGKLSHLQEFRVARNGFMNDLTIPDQEFLTSLTNCRNLTTLSIDFNPITGSLPISIGNLSPSLENFVAAGCRLGGTIPSEIGNITSLFWLDFGSNNLTGEVPATLGNLRNLQVLILSFNNLHGSLPASICGLENVFRAAFGGNRLSGQLPACLGDLTSLRELYLYNNSFNSTIPSTLWYNARIQILSLFGNLFYGSLPSEIGNLNNLEELYLYENQLTGNIPVTIGELSSLTTVQLQNNRLNGLIPPSIADLNALQYLDLSQNNLSGSIPKSLEKLAYLDYFNVSFNQLTGEIPDGGRFGNFTAELFVGNRGLCGSSRFSVKACQTRKKRKLLRFILPSIASVLVAAVLILWLLKNYFRKSKSESPSDTPLGLTHERISYYEILRATSNLDTGNLIGKGGIGSVYRGLFSNEKVVAVKVFNLEMQDAFKSFDTECQIMRGLRHRNLVKVITSCSNLDFKALVMEYMPNGNLDKWLHSSDFGSSVNQRIGIMVDVASAIEYLHHGYSSPIVHCDLKPSNILLDKDMVAHVADFGISKLLMEDQRKEQTKTLGTIGYMAPEYGQSGIVSTMADVYSFGILLMETFTRKRPTDELFLGELTMHRWVSESYPGNIMQIVDEALLSAEEGYVQSQPNAEECLRSNMELAIQCTMDVPEERPNMKDVLVRLKKIHAKLH